MNQTDFSRLLLRYSFGFAAALILSIGAYFIAVSARSIPMDVAMLLLLVLALMQLLVQLTCFLHLRLNDRSAIRSYTFGFTIIMMLFIVIGSIWIMRNLDYRMMMSGELMNDYMTEQNKKGF